MVVISDRMAHLHYPQQLEKNSPPLKKLKCTGEADSRRVSAIPLHKGKLQETNLKNYEKY